MPLHGGLPSTVEAASREDSVDTLASSEESRELMSIESMANKLIVPASMPGRVMQALVGTGEQLIAKGRINSSHRIAGHEGVEIEAWVLNSRLVGQIGDDPVVRKITRGTVLLVHPLMASKPWFLAVGEKLAHLGWDVVLPELRGHGNSGGRYITWGAKEKHDLKAVMDRLTEQKLVSERIFVIGSSLGGAVAVQYAAIEPHCRGVMALAPPKSARAICRRILMLASPRKIEAALSLAIRMADFDPDDASAEASATGLRCPLLLIHGLLDFIVPYNHGQAIYRACRGTKKLQTDFLRGHSLEFCRDAWVVKQFGELQKLAAGTGDC